MRQPAPGTRVQRCSSSRTGCPRHCLRRTLGAPGGLVASMKTSATFRMEIPATHPTHNLGARTSHKYISTTLKQPLARSDIVTATTWPHTLFRPYVASKRISFASAGARRARPAFRGRLGTSASMGHVGCHVHKELLQPPPMCTKLVQTAGSMQQQQWRAGGAQNILRCIGLNHALRREGGHAQGRSLNGSTKAGDAPTAHASQLQPPRHLVRCRQTVSR